MTPKTPRKRGTGDERLGATLYDLRPRKNKEAYRVGNAVGCSQSHLHAIERGDTLPSLRLLVKLAAYYGLTLDALAGHLVRIERDRRET